MLIIEEIKEAIDAFKPDGFEIRQGVELNYFLSVENLSTYAIKEYIYVVRMNSGIIKNLPLYDLFLDRIIQGMNREIGVNIVQQDSCVDVWHKNNGEEPLLQLINNCSTEGIREAREKAIRFVLVEMKGQA